MEKKNYIKLLAIIACIFSVSLTSCGDSKEETPSKKVIVTDEELDKITTHKTDVGNTTYSLVENKLSDYCVVYPNDLKNDTNFSIALSEFNVLFKESTGITIPMFSDNEMTRTNKILSIGLTKQALNNNVLVGLMSQYNLGTDGFVIKTINDSVFMTGNTSIASLYSVYEFFHYEFSFENYAEDEYFLEKNVQNKKILDFNVVEIPDFDARTSCNDESISKRFRTISYTDGFNSAKGNTFVHNYFNLVPETNKAEHPKWFYGNGPDGQLCLEAHGDEKERMLLKNYVVSALIDRLEAQPDIDWIAFSHNDGGQWCNCHYCTCDASKYDHGENTAAFATVIKFVNLVAKDIKVWNETVCPNRNILIFIYDYGKVTWAPVKLDNNLQPVLDADGNYQPYSDELILEPNVAIYWCGFGVNAAQSSLFDDINKTFIDKLKRSQVVMSNPIRYIWTYSANYSDYFLPVNTIDSRQERYKLFKKLSAKGVFDQAQFNNKKTSDWGALKSYVSAKLLWNCRLNVGDLVRNFMKYYFGSASETMLDMFNKYCSYMLNIAKTRGYLGNSHAYLDSKYFKYGEIKEFENILENAYKDISQLKDADYEAWVKYYNRIKKESLTWRYLELSTYPNYFTTDKLNELQKAWLNDAMSLGITNASELSAINTIFG